MNKMKIAGISLALLTGLVLKGMCAVSPPRDAYGTSLPTIDFVGAIPCSIANSTGTNQVLCASGRSVVYGVVASSVASTDFLVLRDSNTANLTSSTGTIVYANGTDASATGVATQTFRFPVPIKFTNGISANVSVAPTSGTGPVWTILYRPLLATE